MTIKNINLSSPLTLSILTGILLGTSTIPFPPWALFFSLSPLFYIWLTEEPKKVFIYTTISFSLGSLIGFFWLSHVLTQFALLPWAVSTIACVFFACIYHLHLSVFGYVFAKWIRPFSNAPILSATAFFAFIWSVFPLLFPWNFSLGWLYGGLQGYQFADIIGSDGLSGLTIFLNAAFLYSFVKFKKTKLPLALSVLFVITFNFAGSLYVKTLPKTDKTYNVVLGQANIGNLEKRFMMDKYNYKEGVVNDYLAVTEMGLAKSDIKPDLVIWPETAFPEYYDYRFFQTYSGMRLVDFVRKNEINLITGVFAQTPNHKTANAALFLNTKGLPVGTPVYKKILLAFGEYMPGESIFPILRKWFPMVGDFERGDSPQVRVLDGVKLGVQICYEGLYPWFSRGLAGKGAELMVNLTNDSWYGPYSEPWQHLYLSAFRVIETRLPLIRSTNTGISTVILADGTFLEQSPLFAQWGGFYTVPYTSSPKKTIYQQWGYAIPLPLILILFIISFIYKPKEYIDNDEVRIKPNDKPRK